jgi:hypothetical protein
MDVVFFAGPVVLRDAFRRIDWRGRDVRLIAVQGSGSSYFSRLAEQLRDRDGRILPKLLHRYGVDERQVEEVALAAYSAGHGLLNKVAAVPADRRRLSAMILSDATFSSLGGEAKQGYTAFAVEAAQGQRLMISTTANTTDGTHLSGRDSWALVWERAMRDAGRAARLVPPRPGIPAPSGGWWRLGGSCYWGAYADPAAPPNKGNDLGHGQHHDLAPAVWQAYLAPWLDSVPPAWLMLGAAGAGGAAYLWSRRKRWRQQATRSSD